MFNICICRHASWPVWWLLRIILWPCVTHAGPVLCNPFKKLNIFECIEKMLSYTLCFILQPALVWWWKIVTGARNQVSLVVYYLPAKIVRCDCFIFRANFRGAFSPACRFKPKRYDVMDEHLQNEIQLCIYCMPRPACAPSLGSGEHWGQIPAWPHVLWPWSSTPCLPPYPSSTASLSFLIYNVRSKDIMLSRT